MHLSAALPHYPKIRPYLSRLFTSFQRAHHHHIRQQSPLTSIEIPPSQLISNSAFFPGPTLSTTRRRATNTAAVLNNSFRASRSFSSLSEQGVKLNKESTSRSTPSQPQPTSTTNNTVNKSTKNLTHDTRLSDTSLPSTSISPPPKTSPFAQEHISQQTQELAENPNTNEDPEAEMVEMWNRNAPEGPEWGGPRGYEPTRHGDWARNGRVSDF